MHRRQTKVTILWQVDETVKDAATALSSMGHGKGQQQPEQKAARASVFAKTGLASSSKISVPAPCFNQPKPAAKVAGQCTTRNKLQKLVSQWPVH
jgi:hypothetical protein